MKKNCNWPKHLLQWGTLAAIVFFVTGLAAKIFTGLEKADPEAYCPMGGLEAFTTYLVRGSLPCSMSSVQILMGLTLAAAVILFSKLFCAYLCPVGTVEDLLMKLRNKLGFASADIRNGSVADKILRVFKYALLFWIFYSTATASELFCKKLDPYYAVATGFKGEIVLWMSITSVSLVIAGGLLVKRFWCRYICPLGAASNTLKFWPWLVVLSAAWWALMQFGVEISWLWFLGAFCVYGYCMEIFCSKPKFQLLHVCIDNDVCGKTCHSCQKNCPYGIDVPSYMGKVNSVDCTLCGECVAACPRKALNIGSAPEKGMKWTNFLPAVLTVLLTVAGLCTGSRFELPTIDETWDVTEDMQLETLKIENLKSVKCYGSSMAFKARMQNVRGVHGVKTYVGSHSVVLKYDPKKTNPERLQEEVFVPSNFRVNSPDPKEYSELKIMTIRTEKMYDKSDLNMLGLQFRLTGRKIFGLASEYNCPLIVRVYMDPEENPDEEFFRETVNKKTLDMPVHGGGVKQTALDFEFVRLEKETGSIAIDEYLHMMFSEFKAEYNGRYPQGDTTVIRKRAEVYADQPQFIYEVVDQNYEKPIVMRALPFLSNHLSKEEGVIGTYLRLNKDLLPSIQVRFAAPMTADRIWELMTMDTWTITYKSDDVREEPARLSFKKEGECYSFDPSQVQE